MSVAGRSFSDEEILTGEWPIIATRPPVSPLPPASLTEGKSTGGSVVQFLDGFFGIRAWDELYDCDEYDDWLLPGVVARQRRLRRDIFNAQLHTSASEAARHVDVGPATIHLLLAYKGGSRPRIIDKPKIRALAERLRPLGGGSLDRRWRGLLRSVRARSDVAALRDAVDRLALELRIKDDILLECYPPFVVDWQ